MKLVIDVCGTSNAAYHIALRCDGRLKVAKVTEEHGRITSVEQDLSLVDVLSDWDQLTAWGQGQLALNFPNWLTDGQLEEPDVRFYLEWTRLQKLMELADRAKTAGQYPIANCIFAAILDRSFQGNRNISLEWETDDTGFTSDFSAEADTYYDLLVVIVSKDKAKLRLCIPVPMVSKGSALAALKRATVVSRLRHNRWINHESETASLWTELFAIVDRTELYQLCLKHLQLEDTNPIWEYLSEA